MFTNSSSVVQVNLVAQPGPMTELFQDSLRDLSLVRVNVELTADLKSSIIDQAELISHISSEQDLSLTSLFEAVKIVLIDKSSLETFSCGGLSRVLSMMCGSSNSEALEAYDARVSAFYCLNADRAARGAQMDALCQKYQAKVEALVWRIASQRLLGQRCCSLAGLIRELDELRKQRKGPEQIALRSGTGWQNVDWQCIKYIEAAGDYMCVYTHDETLVVRSTMTELNQRLPAVFTRINRSVIVNSQFVKGLIQLNARVCYVELRDGSRLKMSRRLMPRCTQKLNEFTDNALDG